MDDDDMFFLALEERFEAPELVEILELSVEDIWDAFYDTCNQTKRGVLLEALGLD